MVERGLDLGRKFVQRLHSFSEKLVLPSPLFPLQRYYDFQMRRYQQLEEYVSEVDINTLAREVTKYNVRGASLFVATIGTSAVPATLIDRLIAGDNPNIWVAYGVLAVGAIFNMALAHRNYINWQEQDVISDEARVRNYQVNRFPYIARIVGVPRW